MKTEHVIMIVAAIVIIIIVVVIIVVMSSLTPTLCYTVSAGKDWSGTYNPNGYKFGGRQTYVTDSAAYYLVWDKSTSYWTFLSKAQLQRVITSGLIATDGSGARTAIVPDDNGNPANSTAINDWQTSDATGTFSLSC